MNYLYSSICYIEIIIEKKKKKKILNIVEYILFTFFIYSQKTMVKNLLFRFISNSV